MAQVTQPLRVGLREIWAMLKVETSSCGFSADKRPQFCSNDSSSIAKREGVSTRRRLTSVAPTPGFNRS